MEISWLKTLVAFANTDGGSLIIGVEDKSHKIVSLDHETADRIVLMVHRQISSKIQPQLKYEIKAVECLNANPTRYILKIDVDKSLNLPVMLQEEGLIGIYVRDFGRTVMATSEQVRDLVLLSDNSSFDAPITDIVFDRDNFSSLLALYREKTGNNLTEKALISIGFMNSERKLSKGALLFSDNNTDDRTKITAVLWPGLNKGSSVVLATEEYTGSILNSIRFAVDFIKNHSIRGFIKEETGRSEYCSYPERSIFESVVNAVAHRNYFMTGSQIEINIFKDRLEITSPGSLLGVRILQKETNISSIIPRRRNEIICSVLEICKYMESKGSGFDKIEQDYSVFGSKYSPFVSSDSSSFTLTLPDLTYSGVVSMGDNIPNIYVSGILEGKKDENILSFCFSKERTIVEIADYIGVKPSTYFRKEVISRLVKQGYLLENSLAKPAKYIANDQRVFLK
ncbi:MAG: putative DNA binding domain-containing protein [Sphaerochaetaceae bacterium]|nr:putative DNA binding domain-containing protein [Sphaerochaetaceae bacterium]